MKQIRKISKKSKMAIMRKRCLIILSLLAIGSVALYLFFALAHIGLLSIEYSEAYYNGDTYWANRMFNERQAIGNGSGIMAFLYNLPFVLKLILTIGSGIVSCCVIYIFCNLYKTVTKPKHKKTTKVQVKQYNYQPRYQIQTRRSW